MAPQHTETIVCCLTAQKPEITLGKRNIEKEARKGQEEKTTNEKHIEKINFILFCCCFLDGSLSSDLVFLGSWSLIQGTETKAHRHLQKCQGTFIQSEVIERTDCNVRD